MPLALFQFWREARLTPNSCVILKIELPSLSTKHSFANQGRFMRLNTENGPNDLDMNIIETWNQYNRAMRSWWERV